jgi:hypothetical protein
MLFLSVSICFAVFAAIEDLLGCYFTASPFFCVPPVTESHQYVANKFSYTPTTTEYICWPVLNFSKLCYHLTNFNILFFLLDTDTSSSITAVIDHHTFTVIKSKLHSESSHHLPNKIQLNIIMQNTLLCLKQEQFLSLQCTHNSIFMSAYCDLIKEVNSTDLQYLCLSVTITGF